MNITLSLRKLRACAGNPLGYRLALFEPSAKAATAAPPVEMPLNEYLGQHLILRFTGDIHCIHCGRKTRRSFQQGYCYPCSQRLAACDLCMVKPERCHFAQGTCREPEWAMGHCMQAHRVYLANTSGLKVGITRESQIPTRWIDQGASQALAILHVATRHQAGLVEVALAEFVKDKTDWRAMLKGEPPELDLPAARDRLLAQALPQLTAIRERFPPEALRIDLDSTPVRLSYPVRHYPAQPKSLNLDKDPCIEGQLWGIKGQYLIFDTGVVNVRKFAGYCVRLTTPA